MIEKKDDYYAIMVGTGVVGIILLLIGLVFVSDKFPWIKGVSFSTIFTMLRIALMQQTLNKAIDMDKSKASRYAVVQYSIRYLITGLVLMIGILEPSISFLGVCLGLFTMKIAIYVLLAMGKLSK